MVRVNSHDPEELPPHDHYADMTEMTSSPHSFFGGSVERRPGMLLLACSMVTASGFIVGALLTLAILGGFIEIDPKAIKTLLKTLVGKS